LDWNSFSFCWYNHIHRDTAKSTTNDSAKKSNKKGKENKNKLKFHCYDVGLMDITGLYYILNEFLFRINKNLLIYFI